MSRSNRCRVIALAIVLLSSPKALADYQCEIVNGLSSCDENAKNPEQIDWHNEGYSSPRFVFVDQPSSQAGEAEPGQSCNHSEYSLKDTDCRDLIAQETMAFWTRVLGWVGLISIPLLIGTLIANTLSVSAARQVGKAQTRAYLGVHDVIVHAGEDNHWIVMCVKNYGVSPARKVKIEVRTTLRSKAGEALQNFCDPQIICTDIAAGGRIAVDSEWDAFNEAAAAAYSSEGADIAIRGLISYNDVFGDYGVEGFEFGGLIHSREFKGKKSKTHLLPEQWRPKKQ